MRTQRGFTLAEVIIVMVLTGILAAVALPRMFNMDQFSARGTHDFVGASLRYAQKSAIAMRRNVCVGITATQMSVTYASTSGAGQPCAASNLLIEPGNGVSYIALTSDTNSSVYKALSKAPVATPANLVFDAQGRPLSATSVPLTAALTISVTGYATPITIEPETGSVH
jgi:MSHA pilin protein MshC